MLSANIFDYGPSRCAAIVCAAVVLLSCFGCKDPEHQFKQSGGAGEGAAGTGGASGECPDVDGSHLLTLSLTLNPRKAIVFDATVVSHLDDGALTVDLSIVPLSAADQKTPVGDALSWTALATDPDGSFAWDLGVVTVIEEANPIVPRLVTTLKLVGQLCATEDFICGSVTGTISSPIEFDLTGSTFTMQRYDGAKPDPLINCSRDPAVYR